MRRRWHRPRRRYQAVPAPGRERTRAGRTPPGSRTPPGQPKLMPPPLPGKSGYRPTAGRRQVPVPVHRSYFRSSDQVLRIAMPRVWLSCLLIRATRARSGRPDRRCGQSPPCAGPRGRPACGCHAPAGAAGRRRRSPAWRLPLSLSLGLSNLADLAGQADLSKIDHARAGRNFERSRGDGGGDGQIGRRFAERAARRRCSSRRRSG